MDLFTYLMAKNGNNTSVHGDLFSYLLGKAQGGGGQIKTASGITIYIPDATRTGIVSFMMTKESTQETSILPSGYTQVNYIESSNTSNYFIDTGIKGTQNTKIELSIVNLEDKSYIKLCGSDADYQNNKALTCELGTAGGESNFGTASSSQSLGVIVNQKALIEISNDGYYVNGTLKWTPSSDPFETTGNLYLFKAYGNSNGFHGQIYYCKIYESGVLVRDFIPCYRDNDNVVGMYNLIGETFYTNSDIGYLFTYGSVVQIPNPDYPQEVNVVEGYRNLFDKDNANILNNVYLASKISSQQGAKILYIACKPNTTYIVQKILSARFVIGYTNFIPELNVTVYSRTQDNDATSLTITTGSNAQYLVMFYYYSTYDTLTEQEILDSIMISEGNQELPYVPYGNNYILYKQVGKNLFDKDNANILNAQINSSSVIYPSPSNKTTYISAKPNTTYTITKLNNDSNYNFFVVGTSNVLPAINGRVNQRIENKNGKLITITTDSQTNYLVIWFYNIADDVTEQQMLDSIMIEKGSTATEYEPYKESNVPIPLNNNIIAGIGDYKDELLVDKSGNVFINKKTGKIILDGTTNAFNLKSSSVRNIVYLTPNIDNMKRASVNTEIVPAFCSHFINDSSSVVANLDIIAMGIRVDKRINFGFGLSSNLTTLEQANQWLTTQYNNGTPVITYYPLATPELIDLQTTVDINLFKGVNNVSNSEDGYMTIEYH